MVSSFFFFFLTSLLEYDCFTMVCQFLLYNKVNQLYICSHISSLLCLPLFFLIAAKNWVRCCGINKTGPALQSFLSSEEIHSNQGRAAY